MHCCADVIERNVSRPTLFQQTVWLIRCLFMLCLFGVLVVVVVRDIWLVSSWNSLMHGSGQAFDHLAGEIWLGDHGRGSCQKGSAVCWSSLCRQCSPLMCMVRIGSVRIQNVAWTKQQVRKATLFNLRTIVPRPDVLVSLVRMQLRKLVVSMFATSNVAMDLPLEDLTHGPARTQSVLTPFMWDSTRVCWGGRSSETPCTINSPLLHAESCLTRIRIVRVMIDVIWGILSVRCAALLVMKCRGQPRRFFLGCSRNSRRRFGHPLLEVIRKMPTASLLARSNQSSTSSEGDSP